MHSTLLIIKMTTHSAEVICVLICDSHDYFVPTNVRERVMQNLKKQPKQKKENNKKYEKQMVPLFGF